MYFCSKVDLKSYSKNKSSFDVLLLLLSGDVEINPGPDNWYSLWNPKMCGFFRTAVYLVFECQILILKNENDLAFVEVKQGFSDMKTLFKDHFDVNQIEFKLKSLKKNISRFQEFNKTWGRNDCDSRDEYYNTFSPANWDKLSDSEKCKHTLFCNECPKLFCQLMAKFPSTANTFQQARMENPFHVVTAHKKKLKTKETYALKDILNKVCGDLNKTFGNAYGVSFDDSFREHNQLEKKQSSEAKKQLKKKHFKEVVDKMNVDNEKTMVDRLFGSGISKSRWDNERMKKSFETVPEAESRSFAKKRKVESGLKKTKDHVGSFSSYHIDPALLDTAASWTAMDDVVWKRIGDKYVRNQNGDIPLNSGQIAKLYLIDKENNEGFQYTFKAKNDAKTNDRIRRCKKHLISDISFPTEPSSKQVKEGLEEEVASGEIDIGENIVQRSYQRTVFDKSIGQ